MKAVNKSAAQVLDLLTEGLQEEGDRNKTDNRPGYMAVVVELIESSPAGSYELFSVTHYYRQNGDLMRDPEMIFFKSFNGQYYPVYYRQDSLGVEQESVVFMGRDSIKAFYPKMQAGQAAFANIWMRNIKLQQF